MSIELIGYAAAVAVFALGLRVALRSEQRKVTSVNEMLDAHHTYQRVRTQLRDMAGSGITIRYCPDCPDGPDDTYAKVGDDIVSHSRRDCPRIALDHAIAALTEEDRVWLREHGWNGR